MGDGLLGTGYWEMDAGYWVLGGGEWEFDHICHELTYMRGIIKGVTKPNQPTM